MNVKGKRKIMETLPEETSLHRIIVALAVIGWYTEIRMDEKGFDCSSRMIGLWVYTPYWQGMPIYDSGKHIGWFDVDNLENARIRLLAFYARAIKLKAEFLDSVPSYNSATKDYESSIFSSKNLAPYLADCANGRRKKFEPKPQNLPSDIEGWLKSNPVKDASDENILSYMMEYPNERKGDCFIHRNMFNLKFYAMGSYGIVDEELWYWDASVYSCRMIKGEQAFRMLPGIKENHVKVYAHTNSFDEAINAVNSAVDKAFSILDSAEGNEKIEGIAWPVKR